MKPLQKKRILILVGEDYEDLELWYPKLRLQEAGATVVVAGPKAGQTYLGKHGYPCVSDAAVSEVWADDFDGLVIPGGWMPDKLRRDRHVLDLTRRFNESKKMVASICHGPSINISAEIVRGVRMTSSPGVRDDLINAGAEWEDAPVVVDGHHISSRRPDDLPEFAEKIIVFLSR